LVVEYETYLESVSKKLEADDYKIEAVTIPGYKIDLHAFRDITEMSMTSTHKIVTVIFTRVPQTTRDVALDVCNTTLTYETGKRGGIVLPYVGLFASRLIFPVICSRSITADGIAFTKSYSPFLPGQYLHPILVDLETGQVHHHTGLIILGLGYRRISNNVVTKYVRP
jgi:hypothetical protein